MSTPAAQIITSGTPVTSQLGTGAVAGNAVTIGGLTLAPNQPGWRLSTSQGGPGFVSGTWQYGAPQVIRDYPAQGARYRSSTGGAGSGGSYEDDAEPASQAGFQLTGTGWLIIGLLATLILTGKGK